LASYMEEAHASDLDALAGVIFHHYDRAGNGEQTVRYGVRAGDHARRLFASAEAVRYYRRGMDVLAEARPRRRKERVYLLERVGDCLEVTGRYKEAAESFSQARREWQRTDRDAGDVLVPPASEHKPVAREAVLCH